MQHANIILPPDYILERMERDHAGHRVFVARPGSRKSYTPNLLDARRYPTARAAQADACGHERARALADEAWSLINTTA